MARSLSSLLNLLFLLALLPLLALAQADLTIREAALLKKVSDKTIRRWIATGELPAKRLGKRLIRIRPEDLDNVGSNIPNAAS